jgi:hypothetical protein
MIVLTIVEAVVAVVGIVTGIGGLAFFGMPVHWAISPFLASTAMIILVISNILNY